MLYMIIYNSIYQWLKYTLTYWYITRLRFYKKKKIKDIYISFSRCDISYMIFCNSKCKIEIISSIKFYRRFLGGKGKVQKCIHGIIIRASEVWESMKFTKLEFFFFATGFRTSVDGLVENTLSRYLYTQNIDHRSQIADHKSQIIYF